MAETATGTIQDNERAIRDGEERGERLAVVDYKMVTFSLAGKDYAIDIMQVKEIAKAGRFTYVPNTSPFVLGVYNLRGEIIPIIDLRIFFNIPTKQRQSDSVENMIIISVDEQMFGIVVDAIDKVVGISKSAIQPPHPIFGDINIKYIHGVVENQGRLYILLDVARIFGSKARVAEAEKAAETLDLQEKLVSAPPKAAVASSDELDISFIGDTLAALAKFHVTKVNDVWVTARYRQWRDLRTGNDVQLAKEEDARAYLETFPSPWSNAYWDEAYAAKISALLPDNQAKQINVWNVGCGKGYETYSLAVVLKERYPSSRIRVFANDSDLLAISNAPMLSFPESSITPMYKPYLVQGVGGAWSFSQVIKDMIMFEYHDCANQNSVPPVDLIVARDVLSYMNPKQQLSMIADFAEKLKGNGLVILGANEAMPQRAGWLRVAQGDVVAFGKE